MRRHPILSLKHAEYLSKTRAAITEKHIRAWYAEVAELIGPEGVEICKDPSCVFNTNETAFYVNPDGGLVIGEKGRTTSRIGDSNKENLTVLVTANGEENMAPPFALFSGLRLQGYVKAAIPENWGYDIAKRGWMTAEAFHKYIRDYFFPYLIRTNVTFPVILFLDGHASHLSLALSEFCKEKRIIVVCLFPNATHVLQPLDVTFFGPFKKRWRHHLRRYKEKSKLATVQRHNIPALMAELLESEDFSENLAKGFRTCSLIPFDPDGFNYSKLMKPTSAETNPVEEEERESHRAFIEKFVPADILTEYQLCALTETEYDSNTEYIQLFCVWREACRGEDFAGFTFIIDVEEETSGNDGAPALYSNEIERKKNSFEFETTTESEISIDAETNALSLGLPIITVGEVSAVDPETNAVPITTENEIPRPIADEETDVQPSGPIAILDVVEVEITGIEIGESMSMSHPTNENSRLNETTTVPFTSKPNVGTFTESDAEKISPKRKRISATLRYLTPKRKEKPKKKRNVTKFPPVVTHDTWQKLKRDQQDEKARKENKKEERAKEKAKKEKKN
jgi:hypothetical protein